MFLKSFIRMLFSIIVNAIFLNSDYTHYSHVCHETLPQFGFVSVPNFMLIAISWRLYFLIQNCCQFHKDVLLEVQY